MISYAYQLIPLSLSLYRLQNISAPIVIVINKLDLLNRTSSSMKSHHMPMKLKKPSNNKHNDKMRLEEHNNNNNNNHTIKSWDEIVHYWQTLVPQAGTVYTTPLQHCYC